MIIRKYEESDCKYLAELFYDTVHSVNANDYTEEQLNAWATENMDLGEWNKSLSKNYSVVAVENDVIVGFGDMDKTGYLDRLFVHKDYQHKGIATAICNELENAVNTADISANVSITARSFFEKRGYKVIKKQEVERQGIILTNYNMKK